MRWLSLLGITLVMPASLVSDAPEADGEAGPPATRIIRVGDDGTQAEEHAALTLAALSGEYGDGSGWSLDLRPDGSFRCALHGCCGLYGEGAGTWALGAEGVALSASWSRGHLGDRPFEPMRVAALRGHYLLVRESWMPNFAATGPFLYNCLRRREAESDVNGQLLRAIRCRSGRPVQ